MDANFDLKNLDFNDIANWPRKIKIWSVIIIAVLSFAIVFFLFCKPKINQININEQQEADLKMQLTVIVPQALQIAEDKKQLKIFEQLVLMHNHELPQAKDLADILQSISKLASFNQVDLLLLKPQANVQEDFYIKIPIQIKVSGTYVQLTQFINQIAKMNTDLMLEKVNIAPISSSNSTTTDQANTPSNQLNMDITADLYYFSPKPVDNKPGAANAKNH